MRDIDQTHEREPGSRRGLLVVVLALLCLVPFGWLVHFAAENYLDAIFSDQWTFVALVEKYLQGELRFEELWEQQSAHRMLFPRLILLVLAGATHWNHAFEIAISLGCALIVFLTIAARVVKLFESTEAAAPWLAANVLALSLLIFSPSQWKNWLWGWLFTLLLNLVTAVAGLSILSGGVSSKRISAAFALGFIATHSYATGLMYWMAGFVTLLMADAKDSEQRRRAILVWAALSALSIVSFFYGYTPRGPGLAGVLEHPVAYVLYVLTYLGSPIVPQGLPGSAIAGGIGLIVLPLSFLYLRRRHDTPIGALLPFISFALYALGSAAMTAVGRAQYGHDQALASRYIAFGQLLWIANISFLCLSLSKIRRPGVAFPPAATRVGLVAVLVLLLSGIGLRHVQGAQRGAEFGRVKRAARQDILSTYPAVNPRAAHVLCWSRHCSGVVVERLPFLHDNELSLFRER